MNEIKIDLDDGVFPPDLDSMRKRLNQLMYIDKIDRAVMTMYRTKKGSHIYIAFPKNIDLTPEQVLIYQMLCGSDLNRELCNYERIQKGMRGWNVLFKLKKQGRKIISRESYYTVEQVIR